MRRRAVHPSSRLIQKSTVGGDANPALLRAHGPALHRVPVPVPSLARASGRLEGKSRVGDAGGPSLMGGLQTVNTGTAEGAVDCVIERNVRSVHADDRDGNFVDDDHHGFGT